MPFKFNRLDQNNKPILFWWGIVLTWSLLLCAVASLAFGVEKSAEVNSEVLPHRWTAVRLSNVDRGATLEVKLQLDGQATIALVNESQLKRYPRVARPLFRTETRRRSNFSIVAPRRGNYYLIVDNRKSASRRKYSLSITAKIDLRENPLHDQKSPTGNDPLKLLSRVIQTAFVVDPLQFKLTSCPQDNVFTRGEIIYLCKKYLKKLKARFRDNRKINEVVLFVLMREAGHVLLSRWDYPHVNHANVKDEFATALLLMFGRRKSVEIQASHSTWLEPEREGRPDTLRKWLDDPFFVKKWQPFLIPKMQTSYLRLLKKKEHSWASRKLIDRELTRRE
jgi:hypothetical protein